MDSDFESNDLIVENRLTYLNPSMNKNNFPNDPYKILGVIATDYDAFEVIVEYSGGCNEHRFYTWWDGNWSTSTPSKGTFYLLHDKAGESCERMVRDTIKLDLHAVFGGTYPSPIPVVTVRNANSGKSILVDPVLAQLSLEKDCELKASFENMPCVPGIWGNKGFILLDSVSGHEQVWIQPVKNSNDISLDSPLDGNYSIEITALFGFEMAPGEYEQCDAKPEGIILPASIDCIGAN